MRKGGSYSVLGNSKRLEQVKCPSVGDLLNELRWICVMEYYAVVKRNIIDLHILIQNNFYYIFLCEKRKKKISKYNL